MNNVEIEVNETIAFVDAVEQLQKHLAQPNADYPHDLIEQVLQQQECATPKLLAILENFLITSPRDMPDEQWIMGIVALFILSKFREKKAFSFVVRLCSLPHNLTEEFLGDIKTEHIPEFLASTFNGDWKALYAIVTNQHLNQWLRGAVLDAYIILYKNKVITREELLPVFSTLFDELYDDFSVVPTLLVSACCDIHATELYEYIQKYFDHNIVDLDFIDFEDVSKAFSLPPAAAFEKLCRDSALDFVDDLQKDMEWLFRKNNDNDAEFHLSNENSYDNEDEFFQLPFVNPTSRIGRNEPCPCGSKKKYKKCCLNH